MVRVKRRYLLLELIPDRRSDWPRFRNQLQEKHLYKGLRLVLEKMHGDYGLGVLGSTISVKRLNRDTFTTIVRVQREGADLMLTSIPLVRQLHDLPCTIRTLHVSGTINGCLRRLQRIHKSQIKQHLAQSNKDKTDPTTVATKKSPNKDDVCDSDNK